MATKANQKTGTNIVPLNVPKKRGRKPVPANESKSDAFKRLGASRVNAAIEQIRLIGNLSNTSLYEYSEEQIAALESALVEATKSAVSKLRNPENASTTFKF